MDFIIVHEEGAVESFFLSLFSENDSSCRQKPCLSGPRTRRRFLCSISAAGAGDSALQIPAGVTVTLDLNGYTLNRNRSSGDGLGHILLVHEGATLTLKDSRGGGIYSNGTLEISGGGTIGSNTGDDAGGIFNDTRGSLSISGMSITGNTSKLHGGGGVFSGTITINGGTVEAYGALPAYRSQMGTHQ